MKTSYLQNLHTHTTFCDGADTPEEIVKEAIALGFDSIGFSEHSYMACSEFYRNRGDHREAYQACIRQLKEAYRGQLDIFLGLETDLLSETSLEGYDYLIGSVHWMNIEGTPLPIDRSADYARDFVDRYFAGDGIAYAKAYYRHLAELPTRARFDIIGHFDLITKHMDTLTLFDPSSKEYLCAAFEAADALCGKIPFFEVNTGAISRGYRKTPYPSIEILKELRRLGYGAIITSDCHRKDTLLCHFDEAAELLRSCGFREKYILTDGGFVPAAL